MTPVQIKLRKKYRFKSPGTHKSSHNMSSKSPAKHGFWNERKWPVQTPPTFVFAPNIHGGYVLRKVTNV